jgi:glycosyltransferase involved in cell wall biosynthesis
LIKEKKHVLFICSSLDLPGGIERAVVNTANLFQANGHSVTILILDSNAGSFYPIHQAIDVHQENLHFGITKEGNTFIRKVQFLQHILRLRKICKNLKTDIIISTEYSLTIPTVLASKGLGIKLIGWEHHHFYWMKKNKFWRTLLRYTYPKLNVVVTQNKTEKKLYENIGCKAIVIPYVISQQHSMALLNNKTILSIGWLIKRKGVDLIPAVAEKVFVEHPDWIWKVIGEGEEYTFLQSELQRRGLEEKVIFQKPTSHNLESEYVEASVFVLLSRFECLPLVLLEASSFGLPCVAFSCPTGPADIINNDKDGHLVELENVNAMAKAIISLLDDEIKRKAFGIEAKKKMQSFAPEKIYERWAQLF